MSLSLFGLTPLFPQPPAEDKRENQLFGLLAGLMQALILYSLHFSVTLALTPVNLSLSFPFAVFLAVVVSLVSVPPFSLSSPVSSPSSICSLPCSLCLLLLPSLADPLPPAGPGAHPGLSLHRGGAANQTQAHHLRRPAPSRTPSSLSLFLCQPVCLCVCVSG